MIAASNWVKDVMDIHSFKDIKNAQKEVDRLKKLKIAGDIFTVSKGSHVIVCIGKFNQQSAAKEFSKRLKNQYSDCLVRRF